jgi:S-adenosyl-L-methionine hydrolase (adenosine-forming)
MTRIVTLTTDFGQSDYDAGVLKGVIWGIAPESQLVDLSHDISRHSVLEAALLLDRCVPFFPPGTIHVVVVDPGVGTIRRGLAARLGDQYFVAPDNGLITLVRLRALSANLPVESVHLNRPQFWLPDVTYIFHGRDIFAAVAGHLAAGIPLGEVGDLIIDPVLLDIPTAQRTMSGWRGVVMHVDTFGNLSTNLSRTELSGASISEVQIKDVRIRSMVRAFGDGAKGEIVALFDSSGKLSICVVNGDAASSLKVKVGDPVEVILG